MRHRLVSSLSVVLLAALALGCGRDSATEPAGAPAHSRPKVGMPGDARHHLSEYIAVREALAAGDLDAARAAAGPFAKQARAASGSGDPETSLHARLERAITGVEGAADLATARRAFGEVSKVVLEMVAGFPQMAARVDVYACPEGAGDGYPKWIQIRGTAKRSPYGDDPTCGAPTAPKP